MVGIVEAGGDPQPEKIGGMKICVIQCVDIGAEGFAQRIRQLALVVNRGDGIEMRLNRRQTFRLDCGFIQVGVEKVRNLARFRAGRRI